MGIEASVVFDLPRVLALLVFLVPLAYSPGPCNAFFAGVRARSGLRAAVPSLAGYHVATLLAIWMALPLFF